MPGENSARKGISIREADLLQGSTKKIKSSQEDFEGKTMGLRKYGDLVSESCPQNLKEKKGCSYENILMGWGSRNEEDIESEDMAISDEIDDLEEEEFLSDSDDDLLKGIQIVEEVIDGKFICPVMHLSCEEEARIQKPWWRCLIIKLVGCRIRFRLLERKLLQLWCGAGVFKIVDLVYDFYLVKFSCMED